MRRYNIPGRIEQASTEPPTELFDSDGLATLDSNGAVVESVQKITTTIVPDAAGEVRVNGDLFQFYGTSLHTAATVDASSEVIEAVQKITTTTVPNAAGEVRVDGDSLRYFGTALNTAATVDASSEVIEKANKITTATVADTAGDVRVNGDDLEYFGTALRKANRYDSVSIQCAAPSAVRLMGMGNNRQAMTVDRVFISAAVLPGAPGDAFSFNIEVPGTGELFSVDQVFDRNPAPTGFAKTTDGETTYTSYLTEVTGAGTAALGGLDTAANGDYFYVGSDGLFSGMDITMDGANVNAQAAVLAAEYWNGSAWAALTILADGTEALAGTTLGQTGAITWDCPADWRQRALDVLGTKYWLRFSHNGAAALTAGTAVDTATVIRTPGAYYLHLPDQNQSVAADSTFIVHCTEADATAERVTVTVSGSL